jgi:hypothetical protein
MAKKDKKKSKKKDTPGADAVGAVRSAVEKTFHATADSAQSTRTRAQELVDELAGASKRVREMIEQLGVLEDLKKQVDALASRVAALEKSNGGSSSRSRSTASRSTASRSTASRAKTTGGAKKPAASRSSSGTRKTAAASRSRSGSTSSRSASSRSSSSGSTRKKTS